MLVHHSIAHQYVAILTQNERPVHVCVCVCVCWGGGGEAIYKNTFLVKGNQVMEQ